MFVFRDQALTAISQGISSLACQQQKDGSFLSFSSPSKDDFTKALTFNSTFTTSLILDALHALPQTNELQAIQKKAAHFLLGQKSDYWSFNYWARDSKQART